MKALIDAARDPGFPAYIGLVIADRKDTEGEKKASEEGILTKIIDYKACEGKGNFETKLQKILQDEKIELICLSGFMQILSSSFLSQWRDQVLNIHPSLLPAFKGLHVHQNVINSGVRISGCTVHIVRTEVDSGPIIAQSAVPVFLDDTEQTLGARVLAAEHKLYPPALASLASGQIRITGNKVTRTKLAKTEQSETTRILSLPSGSHIS